MSEINVSDYGWNNAQAPESCSYIFPRIMKIIETLQPKRVLDLGAGNGNLVQHIYNSGFEVVGVEYDKNGVEISRELLPQVNFYNYGVQDEPDKLLETESPFDLVVSTEVIEHLYSPHLLVEYASKVLNPNGYLILSTPYHGYLKNMALSVFNKWDKHFTALWHGGHIKFWSEQTLSKLLIDNGFVVESFSGVGRFPYLWKSMIVVAKKL